MVKPLNVGDLRHRVALQSNTPTQDQFGAPVDSWSDVFSGLWAKIEPVSPKTAEFAHTFATTVSHIVTIRYNKDLVDGMRLVFGQRVLAINGFVDEEEMKIKHTLYCTELRGPSAPTP